MPRRRVFSHLLGHPPVHEVVAKQVVYVVLIDTAPDLLHAGQIARKQTADGLQPLAGINASYGSVMPEGHATQQYVLYHLGHIIGHWVSPWTVAAGLLFQGS
ncbi:hypothetical protein HMPREF2129_09200 [Corynebacterium tuscaniense DNF00037]|nr:hypothetical protein HMPREF2129_09200 [Corynebacterium tuscaniense DNF00037]